MVKSLNEVLSRTVVEEFTLPSGKEARRFKFSARDAMNLQTQLSTRNKDIEFTENDFQIAIICNCIQFKNEQGEYEHPFPEDFQSEDFTGFDYLSLLTKFGQLMSKTDKGVNPN